MQDFRLVLDEISAVCELNLQKDKMDQSDQQVHNMQCKIFELLEQLKQTAEVNSCQTCCQGGFSSVPYMNM